MKKILLTLAAAVGLVLSLAACSDLAAESPARAVEQKAAQTNQTTLRNKYPVPALGDSQELRNLTRRAEVINAQNMQGCIYLISYGNVMAFYPVDGKVSSLNSYMLSGDQVIDDPHNISSDSGSVVIEQADIDGAYGQNADGIFFFTADTGSYVEWYGEALFSDQCLNMSGREPALTRIITEQ